MATAAVLALTGFLTAVVAQAASDQAEGRVGVRAALATDVDRGTDTVDSLEQELSDLTAEVGAGRDTALNTSRAGREALSALDAAEAGAATVPVVGPGLRLVLGDELPSAASDPLDPEAETLDRVLDRDLASLLNALWSAGAEAISVNDVRVGPNTAVRAAGGALLVDFQPVLSPYEVRAIGDQDGMQTSLVTSDDILFLVGLSQQIGLVFDLAQESEMRLDAASVAPPRFATAVRD